MSQHTPSEEQESPLDVPLDPTEPLRLLTRLLPLVWCRLMELQLVDSLVPSTNTPEESVLFSGSMVSLSETD